MFTIKLQPYCIDDVLQSATDKLYDALNTTSKKTAREYIQEAIGSLNTLRQLVDIDEEG